MKKCTYTDGLVNYYFTFENGLYYCLYDENGKYIDMGLALEQKSVLIKRNNLRRINPPFKSSTFKG